MHHLPTAAARRRSGMTPSRRFACNALLLIAVNLFMRTVGVSFNAYLAGRAGGEVMGLYSLLSGVYGLVITLGCAGINLGTTRMVADVLGGECGENCSLGDGDDACRRRIRRVLGKCLGYSLICSIAAGFLLFAMADTVGRFWLGDARTVSSLRVLALTLPPIAVSSCLGGYFTAVRRIAKSAGVGIIAQFLRIGFCSFLLTRWLPSGVEMTCLALVLGGALSEFSSLIFNLLAYLWDRHRYLRALGKVPGQTSAVGPSDTRKLLGITVPVTLAACLRSGLLTLQHALIPRGLKGSGSSWAAALSSYGILHGMVLPVVLFPSAFISSYAGLLVPEVAESCARGDGARVARLSYKVITPALVFSFGIAGMMACFGYELGEAIYKSREAGMYIRILAPLIPIMYVDSSVDGVLKGMGEQVYSMVVNIIDALSSVILVWLLLPRMGLWGYVVAIYVTETLNTTLSLCRMLRMSGMRVRLWKQVFGPLGAIVGATATTRMAGHLLAQGGQGLCGTPALVLALVVCGVLYGVLLCLLGVIGPRERAAVLGLLGRRGQPSMAARQMPEGG